MDFIEGLPESSGYDSILVVVDRLSKYAHFIPIRKDITTPELAFTFLREIFSKHGDIDQEQHGLRRLPFVRRPRPVVGPITTRAAPPPAAAASGAGMLLCSFDSTISSFSALSVFASQPTRPYGNPGGRPRLTLGDPHGIE